MTDDLSTTARKLAERYVESHPPHWKRATAEKIEAVILEAMQVALELALIAIETCGKDCELAKGDFCHSADNIAIKRLKSSLAGVGKEA